MKSISPKSNSKPKSAELSKGNKIARETIGTAFFIVERLPRFLSTILSIVGLIWFGSTCFKLGWTARDNFLLRPIAEALFGLEIPKAEKSSWFENFGDMFQE